MTGKTHMAIGLAAVAAFTPHLTPKTAVLTFGAAIIGSLLVDIDHQNSTISHKLFFGYKSFGLLVCFGALYAMYRGYIGHNIALILFIGATIAAQLTPHRSFTHSIVGFLVYYFAVKYSYSPVLVPFSIGYLGHLAADMITNEGIELLFPWRKRIGLGLISTNSIFDTAIGSLSGLFFICTVITKLFKINI